MDELIAQARRFLRERVPADDDSSERIAYEDRWDSLRLRLRRMLNEESLLPGEESLLTDALSDVEAILLGGAAAASGSGAPPSNDSQSGSSTQPPAGPSGSSTQPPGGSGSRTETPPNLRPPTPSQTQPPPPTDLEVAMEQGQRVLDNGATIDEIRAALDVLLDLPGDEARAMAQQLQRRLNTLDSAATQDIDLDDDLDDDVDDDDAMGGGGGDASSSDPSAAPEPEPPADPPPQPATPPPAADAAMEEAAEDEGEEEFEDDDDPLESIVGRATILYRRQPQQWYLAKWKAKPLTEASFVREGYFDTPRLQALLTAFKGAHGGDEDARGLGFAQALLGTQEVGAGRRRHTQYLEWLTTMRACPTASPTNGSRPTRSSTSMACFNWIPRQRQPNGASVARRRRRRRRRRR